MTLREFKLIADAYEERSRHEMERIAWACANLMNCWSKKKIKPADLLPKGKFFKESKGNEPKLSRFEQKMIANKKDMSAFQSMMRGMQQDISKNSKKEKENEPEYVDDEEIDLSGFNESLDANSMFE